MTQVMVIQFCEQMYNIFERASTEHPTMVTGFFMIFDCGNFDYKHLANTDGKRLQILGYSQFWQH